MVESPFGLFHQPISMIEPVRITASAPQTPREIAVAVPSICPKQHGTSSKRARRAADLQKFFLTARVALWTLRAAAACDVAVGVGAAVLEGARYGDEGERHEETTTT